MASSSLVAGPWAARSLNRPRRSPSTHRRVTYVPLRSPITLPMNACTFASSSIGCAVVVIFHPPGNLVLCSTLLWLGDGAELAQQAQHVEIALLFHDAAAGNAVDVDPRCLH